MLPMVDTAGSYLLGPCGASASGHYANGDVRHKVDILVLVAISRACVRWARRGGGIARERDSRVTSGATLRGRAEDRPEAYGGWRCERLAVAGTGETRDMMATQPVPTGVVAALIVRDAWSKVKIPA